MKLLVLGATGMAGHVISLYLRKNLFTVDTLAPRKGLDANTFLLDVTDKNVFSNFLDKNRYDCIINCIGLLVKQSEEHRSQAAYINSYLPLYLMERFRKTNTKIVHISTDGVFAGRNDPYTESSVCDAISFYGRSKTLGEINNEKDITFRTSIIGPDLNPDGTGLFNWFSKQSGAISGYTNPWNGVTTIELARGIIVAVEKDISGLHHFAPSEPTSKFALLKLCKEISGRNDIEITPIENPALPTLLSKTRNDFPYSIPSYPTMITELYNWTKEHPELYEHYR